MDPIDPLARVLHAALRGLGRVGYRRANALSPAELRGASHLLGYGLLLSLWDRRRRPPDWDVISRRWNALLAATPGVDPALYGALDPDDRLELLTDNREAFAVRERLLVAAQRSIELATYYIQGDEVGAATVRALVDAARRGVAVRVLVDEYVTRKKEFEGLRAFAVLDELRSGGVKVQPWRDPLRPYDAQHRKLLVIDGETVVIGGRNYADHYAGPAWRDTELLLAGPSARDAQAVFDRSWAGAPEPRDRPGLRFQATTPAEEDKNPIFLFLLQCARAAVRTIDIENAYYIMHPSVQAQLAAARRRGVRVRLFTNSAESTDSEFGNWRFYTSYRAFVEAGGELYLRRGRGRTLHSKYFVVDGEWVSLGSNNLDYYSPRHCQEVNLQVRSERLGALLTAWFEGELADAEHLTDVAKIDALLPTFGLSRRIDAIMRDMQ